MGMSKFIISTRVVFITFVLANVADGYATIAGHHEQFLANTFEEAGFAHGETELHADNPQGQLGSSGAHNNKKKEGDANLEKDYSAQQHHHTDKYPLITAIHTKLAKVFGKNTEIWYYDWKLWTGLAFWLSVWAKWLKYGYDEKYYQRGLFAFGINVVILHHLQYAEVSSFGIQQAMLGICLLLTAQSCVWSYIWSQAEMQDEDYEKLENTFTCDTMYLDLSLPFEQISVLFVSQVFIWWFYMTSIIGNLDFNHVNYMFWLIAYMANQMTMFFNRGADSVLGNAYPMHRVYELYTMADHITFKLEGNFTLCDEKPFKVPKWNIFMRGVLGFFCNAILREIMAYTIPLMLMGFTEPMDYVVYCVGVNFITTLDDMQDKVFEISDDNAKAIEEAPAAATTLD